MNATSVVQREQFLTVGEIMEMLNISRTHVYAIMNRGQLKYVSVGAVRRIRPSDLESYIQSETKGGK